MKYRRGLLYNNIKEHLLSSKEVSWFSAALSQGKAEEQVPCTSGILKRGPAAKPMALPRLLLVYYPRYTTDRIIARQELMLLTEIFAEFTSTGKKACNSHRTYRYIFAFGEFKII